jgi:amino acid transporter
MLTIYLILGVVIMFAFHILNALSFKTGKAIQLFGTFFKFIPLVIAFIAGFVLIYQNPSGAMFNNGEPNLNPDGNGIS